MDCHAAVLGRRAVERTGVLRWLLLLIAGAWFAQCAADAGFAEEKQVAEAAAAAILAAGTDQRTAIVENFRHDAALADVFFVDRSSGWAVGDRGVVWHTDDGGVTWQQQTSTVDCRLNAVFFLDSRRGWAAGGESRPYNNATRGVVLRTDDGGKNWTLAPRLVLPLVTRVKFFDSHRGVAIGHATAYYPSGVFVTQDGGETWQPLPADRAGGWLAGDFLDADTGAVAGPAGSFATLARRQVVRSPLATPSLHSFHAMRLVAPTGGWLVGDGGVVMATNDLGHSWQSPPNDLPDVATEHFDFHAVAMHGAHVWVAGSPGTRVFHSPDGGQSWQASTTGQQAPLRAIHFVDADFGWAVGDLGSILVTRDGGHSWQVQRSGAKRAALLAIFADANDVPLELIAEAGAADGYITAVDILHETSIDPEATAQLATSEQARAAMLLAGAATAESAWRFPLPPDELALAPADVLDSLNRANDGRAVDQIEKHLVRRLRMWRPDIVVTHHTTLEKSEPKAAVLAALILRSVAAAADSTQYVELADELGLPPWQVKKVYGLLPGSSRGVESIVTGRFSPLLGTTLTDFVSSARQLLATDQSVSPDTYELELVMSQAADTGGRGGLFGGIALAAASDARRPQSELPVNDLTQVRRLAARRRHLEELLERTEGNAAWIGQVGSLINELNPNDGAELLIQLADGYRAAGRLDLAADTYYLLARRCPDHPFVERALVWLVQFYASSEAGHHGSSRGLTDVRQASFEEPDAMTPGVGLARDDRLRRAIQLTDYLKNVRPALYAEPSVRFAEVAAQRQLGFTNPAKRYNLTLRQLPADNPWRQAAETEEWLAKPTEVPPPKPIGTCRRADDRPNLDGKLDERFWNTADRLHLRGAVGPAMPAQESDPTSPISKEMNVGNSGRQSRPYPESAELRLAYDAEFLYVAIRCPKIAGVDYRPDNRPRPRDADLTQYDRVSVRIDIDRDFTTAFELTVDSRGCTYDGCWGDPHWNPDWYVAATSDETSWTVEAAVPLAALVAGPPAARHAWALAVRRIVPRAGYQSWGGKPASDDSPTQFGLLLFE